MNRKTFFLVGVLFVLLAILGAQLRARPGKATVIAPVVNLSQTKVTAAEQVTVQDAGQAKFTLSLTKHALAQGGADFVFDVNNLETKSSLTLFEQQAKEGTHFEAPYNAFAPDDKKLFIKITTQGVADFLVFNTDGSVFRDGNKYLSIRNYWSEAKLKYTLLDATGWADKDLVIISTQKADGTRGPNYWFVVSTRKFMILAH